MGWIYEARHLVVGRRVAVKFLKPELALKPEALERFRREARAAGSLEAENIAGAWDFGVHPPNTPFLVMEYLVGTDLRGLLAEKGVLPVTRATSLVVQACRGLSVAHQRGIVHRDLKPENLFVTRHGDGRDLLKVLDFGIAKLQGHDSSPLTQWGSCVGTVSYMSPEQIRAAPDVDCRADIYSLGVVLYELLTGALPHSDNDDKSALFQALYEDSMALSSLRRELPDTLCAIVHKAMTREARERFTTVDELARALIPFTSAELATIATQRRKTTRQSTPHGGFSKASEAPVSKAPAPRPETHAETRPPSAPPIPWRRHRGLIIAAAAVFVTGSAMVVNTLMDSTSGPNAVDEPQPPAHAGTRRPTAARTTAGTVRRERPADWTDAGPASTAASTNLETPAEPEISTNTPPAQTTASRATSGTTSGTTSGATPNPASRTTPRLAPTTSAHPEADFDPSAPVSRAATRTPVKRAAKGRKRAVDFDLANPYD